MFLVCLALTGRAYAVEVYGDMAFTNSNKPTSPHDIYADVTITLTDVNYATPITNACAVFVVKEWKTLTLVLNGSNSYYSDRNLPFIYLDPNAKLVIKAGTGEAKLTLRNTHTDGVSIGRTSEFWPAVHDNSWEVMVHSGTVDIDKFGGGTGVAGNGEQGVSGGHLKIYGGTVTASLKGGKGGKGKNAISAASQPCRGNPNYVNVGGAGGAGGAAPKLSVYGGTVNITSIAAGEGGAMGDGKGCNGSLVALNNITGAVGGKGDVVIAGGSVTISNAGGANTPLNKSGTVVVRNTIIFDNTAAPTGASAGVNNRNVLCGKIGSMECDTASKWHSDPTTRDARETNGVYGLKDVKTDGNGRFYPWLPNAASEAVELSLYGNCTPMRGTRSGTSATLKWVSITVTYKGCTGTGCNTAFQPVTQTIPQQCN